jgi:hypothetical protein
MCQVVHSRLFRVCVYGGQAFAFLNHSDLIAKHQPIFD